MSPHREQSTEQQQWWEGPVGTGLNESQESTLVVEKGNHILDYIRRRVSSRLREVIISTPWHWRGCTDHGSYS